MAMVHGLDQEALLRVARDDGRAFFAALEQAVAIIEAQVTFLLLRVVAFVALRYKYRADLLLEEFQVRRLEVGGREGGQAKTKPGQESEVGSQRGGLPWLSPWGDGMQRPKSDTVTDPWLRADLWVGLPG